MKHIEIYTDGACRGNPGPGGWGALLISGELRKELSGSEALTTNNRMELLAAIRGLEALKNPGTTARVYTDSQYVIKEHQRVGRELEAARLENGGQKARQESGFVGTSRRTGSTAQSRSGTGCAATRASRGNERVDQLANEAIDAMRGAHLS